jgi:hypothetical protein
VAQWLSSRVEKNTSSRVERFDYSTCKTSTSLNSPFFGYAPTKHGMTSQLDHSTSCCWSNSGQNHAKQKEKGKKVTKPGDFSTWSRYDFSRGNHSNHNSRQSFPLISVYYDYLSRGYATILGMIATRKAELTIARYGASSRAIRQLR